MELRQQKKIFLILFFHLVFVIIQLLEKSLFWAVLWESLLSLGVEWIQH